jgi:GT2 family glycosyltransferase
VTTPAVSVIVPTSNRAESLLRLLRALMRLESDPAEFEVIVVADGCSDRTEERIGTASWNLDLHVLTLPPSGPATARNCGAALARGEILLFLDDDVEPEPGTIRAHLALHRSGTQQIGLGYLPPILVAGGFLAATLRGWWESMFDGPRRPSYRYSFRNLLTGHFSIRRTDFERLRGFEASLSCHEDWEFGYRAIRGGLRLAFVPGAVAWHHDTTDLSKVCKRKFDEGRADVRLARLHPELAPVLPFGWTSLRGPKPRVVDLAWRYPRFGDRALAAAVRVLPLYEHWRLRFRWRALLQRAMTYWYWRGVAAEAGSPRLLAELLSAAPSSDQPELALGLADGLDVACQRVDELRPRSLRLTYRDRRVGDILDEPGSEPLRGTHVRAALAERLARPFAEALASDGKLPEAVAALVRAEAAAPENTRAGAQEAFAA